MSLPTIAELQANSSFEPLYIIMACAEKDNEEINVYHLCAYPEHPGDEDLNQLKEELETDEEFKLDPEVLEKLEFRLYTIDQYQQILKFLEGEEK